MSQRLKRFYHAQVVCQLLEKFNYKNVHQVPSLKKIVLSRGIGNFAQNANALKTLSLDLTIIAAQCSVTTRAEKLLQDLKFVIMRLLV